MRASALRIVNRAAQRYNLADLIRTDLCKLARVNTTEALTNQADLGVILVVKTVKLFGNTVKKFATDAKIDALVPGMRFITQ